MYVDKIETQEYVTGHAGLGRDKKSFDAITATRKQNERKQKKEQLVQS